MDELLVDEDELLVDDELSSLLSTLRAPPRRIGTLFGAALRASLGDRRGQLRGGCFLIVGSAFVLCSGAGHGRVPKAGGQFR